jgi:uncharacterized protein YcsI (UPF0317 family)
MMPIHPKEQRLSFRGSAGAGPTSGLCPGYQQANMLILPESYAFEFLLFCERNRKPCPIVDVLEAGIHRPSVADADIRTDLPKYRVFQNGRYEREVSDISAYWRDDLVTFLLGCSFTFERALIEADIDIMHQQSGRNVAMYETNLPCAPAGRFSGNLVVSMRPVKKDDLVKAVEVTARYPHAHGAPVHLGDPDRIGIRSLESPEYGEFTPYPPEDRVPVFWACGVTSQAVGLTAEPPLMITHSPGHMFITDLPE